MQACTAGEASRLWVPGSPPGSIMASRLSGSTSSAARSAFTAMPWEPVTSIPVTPASFTVSPARRMRSTGARASTSSKPSAKNTTTIENHPFLYEKPYRIT